MKYYWLILFLLIVILWFINFKINGETYYFNKYAQLNYYKPCGYDKQECVDILNYSREKPSKYNKGDICIVTVSIGERDFSKINKERMIKYCELYGYDMMYFTQVIDPKYPVMWQKCVSLDKVLNMKDKFGNYKYKVVAWFDDDIYLTNMKYRTEDFLSINHNKHIFMTRDNIKNNYNHYINAGNYIMRNTKISRDFMKDTLNGMDNLFGGHFRNENNHEQSINTYLYFSNPKYGQNIEVLPYGVLQSFHQIRYHIYNKFKNLISPIYSINQPWKYRDYCIHFASLSAEARYELCSKIKMYNREIRDNNIAYPQTYPITDGDWYQYI